jgi:hypothetical protein
MRIYEITFFDEKKEITKVIQVQAFSFESAMSEVYVKKGALNHSTQAEFKIVRVNDLSYIPRY